MRYAYIGTSYTFQAIESTHFSFIHVYCTTKRIIVSERFHIYSVAPVNEQLYLSEYNKNEQRKYMDHLTHMYMKILRNLHTYKYKQMTDTKFTDSPTTNALSMYTIIVRSTSKCIRIMRTASERQLAKQSIVILINLRIAGIEFYLENKCSFKFNTIVGMS